MLAREVLNLPWLTIEPEPLLLGKSPNDSATGAGYRGNDVPSLGFILTTTSLNPHM